MKAILYARFSPRALPVACQACGNTFKIQAPHSAFVDATCPDCRTATTVSNSESCDSQLVDLREYCRVKGHEIVGECSDIALSGGEGWEDRPGMLDAAVACKRGTLFVVRNYDRLFRDVDKATVFRATLERKGVEVVSASPQEAGANGNTLNAKLIRFVILWTAELQREITRARTKAKMLDHQASGRRMSKQPPYGTMTDPADPKRLIPCAQEQYAISVIRSLHGQGMGLREICRALEARGIASRSGTWRHPQVKRILARRIPGPEAD